MFWSIVIIILLVYFLIIRPMTRNRYRQQPYGNGPQYGSGSYYGPSGGFGGMGSGVGMLAGGLAAGALLTYLLEQGRINADQFDYFNSLDQNQMLQELQQQNIVQQGEIDDLTQRFQNYGDDGNGGYDGYSADDYGNGDFSGDTGDFGGDDWV